MADKNMEMLKSALDNATLNKEQTNVSSSSNTLSTDPVAPEFLATAKRVPFEAQDFVAKYKRENNSGELDKDKLVWAIGDEVSNFEVRKGYVIPVLKMHLEEDNTPIYIFANEAGASYRHLDNYIDQRIKIAVSTLLDTDEVDSAGNKEYIALGSIRQAEFVTNRYLYNEMRNDPDAFKDEIRVGVVTQVIDTPSFRFVSFTYEGIQIGMLAKNFYYQSFMTPLNEVAYIGMKFPFKITDIVETTYEDQAGVKADKQNGRPVPSGIMYQVMTTRLPLLDSPDEEVKSKFERRADFKAHIVRCHPVQGILVEIAPGWIVKGILASNAPLQPTVADEKAHTPVIVRLDSIDEETHRGRAFILRFPRGIARTLDPHNQ